MIDDHKYSIGRTVVYSHPKPGRTHGEYGQYGPARTVGTIRAVESGAPEEHTWFYLIENLRTGETAKVPEPDIRHATLGKQERRRRAPKIDVERLAEILSESADSDESAIAAYLRVVTEDYIRREEQEERVRLEGRQLPIEAGDYIRLRGDLRSELEGSHNHYAKVLEVQEPEIAAIEAKLGTHNVQTAYRVLVDDGAEHTIYDPEIKLYYTADGRKTILNWKAATFLAESFRDAPPYSVEFSYLEEHVFSRKELEAMPREELINLFAAMLYVKGRMGLRDLEHRDKHLGELPKDFIVDSMLAVSRFDMHKNRSLTPGEIESKKKDDFRLRRLLHR